MTLQTRGTYLTFGGFEDTFRSKREEHTSRLEGYCLCDAPNARDDLLERSDLARESNSERKLAQVGSPVDFQREFRKRELRARAPPHVWSALEVTR